MDEQSMHQERNITDDGQQVEKRTVCVVGHKNPDTDSICSAIAYAYLKNQDESSSRYHYVPGR